MCHVNLVGMLRGVTGILKGCNRQTAGCPVPGAWYQAAPSLVWQVEGASAAEQRTLASGMSDGVSIEDAVVGGKFSEPYAWAKQTGNDAMVAW